MKTSKIQVQKLICEFTGQANVLTIPKIIINFCENDLPTALLLSQLMYWNDKSKYFGWVYKTYKDWQDEICLNEYHVRKSRKWLESKGWIETMLKKAKNGSPTVHYRIKDELFEDLIDFLENIKNKEISRSFKDCRNDAVIITESSNIDYNIDYRTNEIIYNSKDYNLKHNKGSEGSSMNYKELNNITSELTEDTHEEITEDEYKKMIEEIENKTYSSLPLSNKIMKDVEINKLNLKYKIKKDELEV